MKLKHILFLLIIMSLQTSCSSYKYFFDENSRSLQQKLRGRRAGNAVWEGLKLAGSIVFAAVTNDDELGYSPDQKEFKNLNLLNPTNDTLYVNMLSDVKWDEENYCDFMDIRIPPGKRCRMLVPKYTLYNLYYSNTPEPDDDEKIEIITDKFRKIKLYSGLSKTNEIFNK